MEYTQDKKDDIINEYMKEENNMKIILKMRKN